jgi:hypothetical protein
MANSCPTTESDSVMGLGQVHPGMALLQTPPVHYVVGSVDFDVDHVVSV